jgi:DNA-binding IclR family transcriptional regulator
MEELEIGVSAIGAAVKNARDYSMASLSVVAPTAALVEEWDDAVWKLRMVAEEASAMLGKKSRDSVGEW